MFEKTDIRYYKGKIQGKLGKVWRYPEVFIKNAERAKKYRKENPEYVKESSRRWYQRVTEDKERYRKRIESINRYIEHIGKDEYTEKKRKYGRDYYRRNNVTYQINDIIRKFKRGEIGLDQAVERCREFVVE